MRKKLDELRAQNWGSEPKPYPEDRSVPQFFHHVRGLVIVPASQGFRGEEGVNIYVGGVTFPVTSALCISLFRVLHFQVGRLQSKDSLGPYQEHSKIPRPPAIPPECSRADRNGSNRSVALPVLGRQSSPTPNSLSSWDQSTHTALEGASPPGCSPLRSWGHIPPTGTWPAPESRGSSQEAVEGHRVTTL